MVATLGNRKYSERNNKNEETTFHSVNTLFISYFTVVLLIKRYHLQ